METKTSSNFWWMKSKPIPTATEDNGNRIISPAPITIPRLDLNISSSLAEFLEKEQNALNSNSKDDQTDVDVGSIIEEINRVAAQSPLGPFEQNTEERSIDDIMREAERIYMESSKSFEQLSQRSKTSQNITDLNSSQSDSTPTPKSVSPLPLDPDKRSAPEQNGNHSDTYSDDFSAASSPSPVVESKMLIKEVDEGEENYSSINSKHSVIHSPIKPLTEFPTINTIDEKNTRSSAVNISRLEVHVEKNYPDDVKVQEKKLEGDFHSVDDNVMQIQEKIHREELIQVNEEITIRNELVKTLEDDNKVLRSNIREIKAELQQTKILLDQTKASLTAKSISSPEINFELERVLENLKDSQEINTGLQLQLDTLNKTHQHLKNSYEDLLNSNKNLERRVVELDTTLEKYRNELLNIQKSKDKLLDNEISLNKLLEIEKLQSKSLKLQNEKDARCIQDLNRQIKEMERIIARKHPDSVSALIVAAKGDATDSNLTARRVLEDRIKALEQEAMNRDSQSSKVFLDIQDKFSQMKLKYESHIEDLELHVNDLKGQLKRRVDTFDVYTQTYVEEQKFPEKDTFTVSTQTDAAPVKPPKIIAVKRNEKSAEVKEETHLLATIRGLQTDLSNKEKVIIRLQKEVDELRKTNRRLQKEREGSLRNLSEKKEFRSYPEKLTSQLKDGSLEDETRIIKGERDKLKQQLMRMEEDYQALKTKRLHDLNALQEAHEREVANYVSSLAPLREQNEVQQVSLSTLQSQLSAVKEELAIVTVERDHLNNRLIKSDLPSTRTVQIDTSTDTEALHRKISFLEKRYEEREHRLRAIVHGLAQKNVTNRSCEQCAERQQQLIGYKIELDQLLATLRALK